jgi:hypothetical protein
MGPVEAWSEIRIAHLSYRTRKNRTPTVENDISKSHTKGMLRHSPTSKVEQRVSDATSTTLPRTSSGERSQRCDHPYLEPQLRVGVGMRPVSDSEGKSRKNRKV